DLALERTIVDTIKDFGYTLKQFYVASAELFGVLGALDSFPISDEQKSAIAPMLYKPVKTTEGDIYTIAAERVLEKYKTGDGYKKVPTVIVARGDLGVDALASVAYARTLQIPILLTKPKEIPEATRNTLDKLNPDSVIVIGGPVAVSDEVAAELSASRRVGGENRYDTAAFLADVLIATRGADTVVITDGEEPAPEAVMLAVKYNAPILFTNGGELPPETEAALKKHRDKFIRIELVGVSQEAEARVNAVR
ncbi:MAG: cell wall-binding repeat-containing protein, partial [Candidatus Hydrothermarchaeaceae archaeon]